MSESVRSGRKAKLAPVLQVGQTVKGGTVERFIVVGFKAIGSVRYAQVKGEFGNVILMPVAALSAA